ncbi:MAG: phage tail tape measure protein [Bacteroidales bacterium]|nr:phage tail tape measure protein [Bacteroidales bacterium]
MAKIEKRGVYLFINGKQIKNDLKSIRTEFYKANADLNKMTVGSEEYNRQLKKVGTLKGILDQHSSSIRQAGKEWSNTGKKADSMLSKLMGSAKGLLPAFGFAAIIGGAIKAGKALFNMYSETAKARQEAEKLTGLSGKPLADFTASVQATADTFNKDFSEVLISTNNFAKTMGISAEDALKKINDGFIAGADSSGEFMDILKEYGTQFKAAGLSADESIALITQQVTSGIYSDKGVDTIKEGTLRLREMTTATKSAIDGIGLSSATIEHQLKSGTISIFEAIQMVSNRLAELPPQSKEVGTAIADVFGGPGEDAGLQYITMLGQAELSLEKVKAGAGENAQIQERLLEANTMLKQAWSDLMGTGTGTFTAIKATAVELLAGGIAGLSKGIKNVRDWFIELYNGSLPVRAGFQYMLASWVTGFNIVKTALQGLWEQFKLGGKLIKAVLTFDLSGIKSAFSEYSDNMKNAVITNAQKVAETWKGAYEKTLTGKINVKPEVLPEVTVSTQTTTPLINQSQSTQQGSTQGRQQQPEMEGMQSIDPRIEVEKSVTSATLEESRLRQNILDNEQKAAADRAAEDLRIQEERRASYLSTLDTIIGVFGEESRIGKAALLAKQAWAIAETIINIAKGTGETAASVPFPANIPMIIGFVAQVAGLISTIKSATNKTKGFAEGGYTPHGPVNQAVGVVHAGEYIVPQRLMRHPVVANMTQTIEALRTRNVNVNPNLDKYASGGFVDTSNIGLRYHGTFISESEMKDRDRDIKELAEAVNKLYQTTKLQGEKKTFVSVTDLSGKLKKHEEMDSQTNLKP